jgi:hypothetical protein
MTQGIPSPLRTSGLKSTPFWDDVGDETLRDFKEPLS